MFAEIPSAKRSLTICDIVYLFPARTAVDTSTGSDESIYRSHCLMAGVTPYFV
jgi:hypothetical protein